jgi:hypothetical protein
MPVAKPKVQLILSLKMQDFDRKNRLRHQSQIDREPFSISINTPAAPSSSHREDNSQ